MHAESPSNSITEPDVSNTDRIYVEAWEKTKGMKARFWQAVIAIILIYYVSINLSLIPISFITTDTESFLYRFINEVVNLGIRVFILTPLFAGLFMMSIKHCSTIHAPINNLFHYFPYWKRLWIFPVVLSGFGYAQTIFENQILIETILYIASTLWVILYFMYIPLSIEQHLPLLNILELSRKTILENWSRVFGFIMVAIVISFVSGLTFGIAFLWTIPWFFNALAVFYRELFGVQISLV